MKEQREKAPNGKPTRKRQRITLTCLYCKNRKIKCDKAKPKCSNCEKLGRVCEYEKPTWVNTSVQQDKVQTDVILDKGYAAKTRKELYEEIKYWKNIAIKEQGNAEAGADNDVSYSLEGCGDDVVDFYKNYDSLAIKHSSHEDYKPLNNMVLYKADPYLSFFLCFRFITIQVSSSPRDLKQDWKSRHPNGDSKWFSLLNMDNGDANFKKAIQTIMSDRAQLFGHNIFPFLHLKSTDDANMSFLITNIKEIIPTKIDMDTFLMFYFRYMWILRPFVEESIFLEDIQRIVVFDNDGLQPQIILEKRRDLAVLASLLIILRYASNSISITDDKHLPVFLLPLKNRKISVKAITVAQSCLSVYNVIKKTTLEIIQAVLLLKFYFKECPEDGDSLTLGQSQILFGSLIQSALAMGLHRDPTFYIASDDINDYDLKIINLKRRLWFAIVGLDVETSILSGTLIATPDPSLVEVYYSQVEDEIEQAIFDEYKKEAKLYGIYRKICVTINRMTKKPTLSEIIKLCDEAKLELEGSYPITNVVNLSKVDPNSNDYRIACFQNHKILEKNMAHFCFEIVIYQLLLIHYEEKKCSNFKLFKKFVSLNLKSLINSFDLSDAYLSNAFQKFINMSQSNFVFYPLISTLTYRCSNSVAAQLVRSYHAQDLLKCPLFKSISQTAVKDDDFDKFIGILCFLYENHLKLYEQVVGTKYHLSLKVICSCKFSFHSLKAQKFSLFNNIINFMEYNENFESADHSFCRSTTEKIKDIRRSLNANMDLYAIYTQWMKITKLDKNNDDYFIKRDLETHGSNCNAIINIHHNNHFTNLSKGDIDEFTQIIESGLRYCSGIKLSSNEDEKFTTSSSSVEDQLRTFYETLTKDDTFDSIINNNVEIDDTAIDNFQLNDDLLDKIFGPFNDTYGYFGF